MSVVTRVGLVLIVPIFVGVLYGAQTRATQAESSVAGAIASVQTDDESGDSETPSLQPRGDDGGTVDLLGNEVTAAVATYKFDATGNLYELHSPQTELPRLGSPKS